MSLSLAEKLAVLPAEQRAATLAKYTQAQLVALRKDWSFWQRPEQHEPVDYGIWCIETGRGWGKTRVGAETTCDRIQDGRSKRIAFVGATASDVRDTMVDELRQNAGILTVAERRGMRCLYNPSKRRIIFPDYHAVITLFSAEEPNRLRGPQFDFIWFDELAAFPKHTIDEVWSNAMFGLRHGLAQAVITTTPKSIKRLREIKALPHTVITKGSSYDNRTNLSEAYYQRVIAPYVGTRLGQQEIFGIMLDDNPDALWTEKMIAACRIQLDDVPNMDRIVVGIDPAGSEEGHEIGIIVAGRSAQLVEGTRHAYCLADYSLHAKPEGWARTAIEAYDEWEADAIVVERNYGGDMVKSTIMLVAQTMGHAPVRVRDVVATRGKVIRAEPISGAHEQGRIHHVGDHFHILEDQLQDFTVGGSNDRVDAYVWTMTDLIGKQGARAGAV